MCIGPCSHKLHDGLQSRFRKVSSFLFRLNFVVQSILFHMLIQLFGNTLLSELGFTTSIDALWHVLKASVVDYNRLNSMSYYSSPN